MDVPLANFINSYHPTYEGLNPQDGKLMKVILQSWKSDIRLGIGEIYPYKIPSSFKDIPAHEACFDYKDDIIRFSEDDYCQATFMAFTLSRDFKSLTLIDKISEKALGVLHLIK